MEWFVGGRPPWHHIERAIKSCDYYVLIVGGRYGAINPNNADLYVSRANFRLFKRDLTGAMQDYDAAVTNGLKTERVFVGRAVGLFGLGDEGIDLDLGNLAWTLALKVFGPGLQADG